MSKKSLLVITLIILSVSNSYSATKMKKYQNPEKVWVNHCKNNDCFGYCDDVGKKAVNYPRIFDNELGTIIGVCWRPKGTLIGISEAIPSKEQLDYLKKLGEGLISFREINTPSQYELGVMIENINRKRYNAISDLFGGLKELGGLEDLFAYKGEEGPALAFKPLTWWGGYTTEKETRLLNNLSVSLAALPIDPNAIIPSGVCPVEYLNF